MTWLDELYSEQPELIGQSPHIVYVKALFWAMATSLTLGEADLQPTTTFERLYCIVMMLFSSVLYASIFGQVTALVDSLRGSSLIDGRDPPRIDYCAFVKSFEVIDTEAEDLPEVGDSVSVWQ